MTRTMKNMVTRIDTTGVLKRTLTFEKKEGMRLSFAIARGTRDDDRSPAFAVVRKAATAAARSRSEPTRPEKTPAPDESGVRDDEKTGASSSPTVTKTAEEHLEKEKVKSKKKKHSDLPQPVQDVLQIFQGEIKE